MYEICLYVLPYGQMSLWGATVITNLMSAIPWLGQDIVESNNIIYIYLKSFSALPVIGIIHKNAIKKTNTSQGITNISKTECNHKTSDFFKAYTSFQGKPQQYISPPIEKIPLSFLAFFVGLIDGDGYIQITKTTKGFITIKLTISLHLDNISLLNYIYSILKLGKISIYPDNRSPTCRIIFNRTELQQIIFPLLIQHKIFFLTETRAKQFNLAMYILENNLKKFSNISSLVLSKEIPIIFHLPETPDSYTALYFFRNWIVGFTTAEGSFLMKTNNDGCFQLKQTIHINLFESFRLIFETNRKIDINKGYNQFGVSSKADICQVINFFSFSGLHPLVGLKNIQYIKWLKCLHDSCRYKNLRFPEVII